MLIHHRMTAFAAKTFHGAHFGEWERDLFIPLELINKMVSFICSRQNMTTGAFDAGNETEPVYDRKMVNVTSDYYSRLCDIIIWNWFNVHIIRDNVG